MLKISPTELRKIVETSGLLKGGNAQYNVVSLEFYESGIRSWMSGNSLVYVFNDYSPYKYLCDTNVIVNLRPIEIVKILRNNFRADDLIELEVQGGDMIMKGLRDKVKVKLESTQVKKPEVEMRVFPGTSVEFPMTKKGFYPRYVFAVDSTYLTESEVDADYFDLTVRDDKLYVEFDAGTYSVSKQMVSTNSYGQLPASEERYRLATSIMDYLLTSLSGFVYIGFLGYDENNEPRPIYISQRIPENAYKLAYFVSVIGR
ncbi:MAG: hypothetical protein QXW42_04410 [Thermofilum sp.]